MPIAGGSTAAYGGDGADYIVMNAAGCTGATAGSVNTISVGQGFFVNVPTNISIAFRTSQRVASNYTDIQGSVLKSKAAIAGSAAPLSNFNLKVKSDSGYVNDLCVAFLDGASDGLDDFDAKKLFGNKKIALYSSLDNDALSIQAFPSLTANKVVPVTLIAGLPGNYTFTCSNNQMNGTAVYLFDALTNSTTQLVDGSTTVTVNIPKADTVRNRFELRIGSPMGIAALPNTVGDIQVYANNNQLFINLHNQKATEATIFNMAGALVGKVNLTSGQQFVNTLTYAPGCYLVSIVTENGFRTNKKFIIN